MSKTILQATHLPDSRPSVDSAEAIIESVVPMDAAEFTEVYRKYQSLVRTVIYQIAGAEALDDLIQDTFVRIWRGYAKFRHDAKITSWIYRISVNTALDQRRREVRRSEVDEVEEVSTDPSQERDLAGRDLVMKGLAALSDEHRTVLVLAFLHELSLSEISEILGISEGTVKSRLHYAKADFRRFLAAKGVEP